MPGQEHLEFEHLTPTFMYRVAKSLVSLHQAKHSKTEIEHLRTYKISRSSEPALNNSGFLKKEKKPP